ATEPATETATAANPKTEPQEAPEAPEAEAPSSEAGYLPEETAAMPAGEIEKSTAQNEARPIAYPERISARITAALSYAQARNPGSITLFGHGTGAYWASHYLHEQTPQDIQQLVIVQPRKPESQEQRLDELASGLELAT